MSQLPKILFIDTSLHRKDATGITLSNLFGNWPKENLYMITDEKSVLKSEVEGNKNCFELGKNEYRHAFPLGQIKYFIQRFKNIKSGLNINYNVHQQSQKKVDITEIGSSGFKKVIVNTILDFFKRIGLGHLLLRCKVSNLLESWIREANPDFLYALLSTRHSILFAIELKRKFNLPLIIHIMDDWPATIGNDTVFSKYWNKKINDELNTLLQFSHKRLAISQLMAEEYKKSFGGDWLYFHNPVDVSLWNKPNKNTKQNKSRTILYSGRLSQGISGTLKLISECVDEINEIDNLDVKFRIQSSGKPDWIDNYNNTTFNFYIPYEELPELYAQVDVLLLPYEFEGKGFDFIRLSMPTKVTEYMASATPILIVAPKSTAVVEYANREGWAYVIDDKNKELIRKGIIELLNNEEIRMSISNNALRCALNYHEINKVQFEFSQIFN